MISFSKKSDRQFMDSARTIAQNLSNEDAKQLRQTIEQVKMLSDMVPVFFRAGMDERFGFSVEVRYADKYGESFGVSSRETAGENEISHSSMMTESLWVTQKVRE